MTKAYKLFKIGRGAESHAKVPRSQVLSSNYSGAAGFSLPHDHRSFTKILPFYIIFYMYFLIIKIYSYHYCMQYMPFSIVYLCCIRRSYVVLIIFRAIKCIHTLYWCVFSWEMATLNYSDLNKIEKRAEKWTLYCIKVWNNRETLLLPFHTNNEEKIQTISTQNYRQLLLDGNTSTIFFTFHLRVVKQFMTIILKVKSTWIKCYFMDL